MRKKSFFILFTYFLCTYFVQIIDASSIPKGASQGLGGSKSSGKAASKLTVALGSLKGRLGSKSKSAPGSATLSGGERAAEGDHQSGGTLGVGLTGLASKAMSSLKGSGSSGGISLDKLKNIASVALPLASQVDPNNKYLKAAKDYAKKGDMIANVANVLGNEKTKKLAGQYQALEKVAGLNQLETGDSKQQQKNENSGKQPREGSRDSLEGNQEEQIKKTDEEEKDNQRSDAEEEVDQGGNYQENDNKGNRHHTKHSDRNRDKKSDITHKMSKEHASYYHTSRKSKKRRTSNHKHKPLHDQGTGESSSKEKDIKKIMQRHVKKMIDSAQEISPTYDHSQNKYEKRKRDSSSQEQYKRQRKKIKYKDENRMPRHNRHSASYYGNGWDQVASNHGVLDS